MNTLNAVDVVRAATYVRMSTEHQQYSLDNQMDVIRTYAEGRGVEIVREYSDGGKSGLSIAGRDSLSQMISDVDSGRANFACILVYDVSRWGRFQDADESAYYEYICKRAGITVHYCAEQFENDGSPISTIVKGVKRAMAAEYSRELSSKVFQGACRLIQMGYKQGGTAGFGLRRTLIDQTGRSKGVLGVGEYKSLQTDRVVLCPGPPEELRTVRWMYNAFVKEAKTETEIAVKLNSQGVLTDLGRAWTRGTVHQVLTNEKYIGNNVYHRTSFKLKKKHVHNGPERWVRANGAFEAIVDPALFFEAGNIILARSQRLTDEEMLALLRRACEQNGRISGILVDELEELPSSSAYRSRFGSLVTAYQLIGYTPDIDYSYIEVNRRLRKEHPELVTKVIRQIAETGGQAVFDSSSGIVEVNGELRVSIVFCRHTDTPAGSSRWMIRVDQGLHPDISIAVRLDSTNSSIRDYYILPVRDLTWGKLRVAEENGIYLDCYRFPNLDYLIHLASRTSIEAYES